MGKFASAHRGRCADRPSGMRMPMTLTLLTAMGFVLVLLGGHTVVLTGEQNQGGFRGSGNQKWAGSWATSPQATSDIQFANQTLRMIVRTSLGGNKVRVRFSNAYGAVPLVIGAAHIALRAPCTVVYEGYRFQLSALRSLLVTDRFCDAVASRASSGQWDDAHPELLAVV